MITKRIILWWMVFIGIIIHMFQKTNINIAIISMIRVKYDIRNDGEFGVEEGICNSNKTFMLESNENYFEVEEQFLQDEKLPWGEHEQNLILSGFFWFAWLAQFFGGIFAHKFGSKLTFGLSNFIGCALSAVIPTLARIDWRLVLGVRITQGFISSLGIPAGLFAIIGHWSPPHERGKFMSVFLGVAFGIAIGYPMFGAIGEYFGWSSIFYVSGILGTIWYVIWLYVVYDSPDEHPTITLEEKKYIQDHIGDNISKEKLPIPWMDILTSVPFLVNMCCQFGTQWSVQTLNIYIPSYLRFVHGMNMKTGGFIAGVAFLLKSIMSFFTASITDFLIRNNIMKTQHVRKLSVFISSCIAGLILLGVPLVRCDTTLAVVFLTLAILIHSFILTGSMVAILDMSPNFSSVLQGICGGVAISSGVISPFVIDQLPFKNNMMEKWIWLFYVCGGISVVTGLMFIFFSNSKLQPWNSAKPTKIRKNSVQMVNNQSET